MLLNPGMNQHRFILERQQVIYRSLRSAGLNLPGASLPDISISSRFQDFPVVDISLRSQCDRVTHFRISVFF